MNKIAEYCRHRAPGKAGSLQDALQHTTSAVQALKAKVQGCQPLPTALNGQSVVALLTEYVGRLRHSVNTRTTHPLHWVNVSRSVAQRVHWFIGEESRRPWAYDTVQCRLV